MRYDGPSVVIPLWLLSWNVNGLRAMLRKHGFAFLSHRDTDILCLQETRAAAGQVLSDPRKLLFPELSHQYFNPAGRPGYSGTAVFCAPEPHGVRFGMGRRVHDREGRLLTLEFEHFFLVNVYTPNAQRGLQRLEYRVQWDRDLRLYLKRLDRLKPVVFCGDLNVAHQAIDLAHPETNHENAGFTDQERGGFGRILEAGFLDSFRELHSEGGHYTWWSMPTRARERNVGWRIDYFCISRRLRPALKEAFILPSVMGSDHCPVGIRLDL
jgi:exodeoxyribonuclease-3